MNITIQPSAISGTITAPASKSAMQRACAAALLKGGTTTIRNYGRSEDDKAALQVIAGLGATVAYMDTDTLKITSVPLENLKAAEGHIHCGESGLSVRMFTPVAALLDQEISISGSGSLQGRPMDFWHEILPQLDVTLTSNNGLLPLTVRGPLQPRDISMDGRLSSQFLTGLLFAYSAAGASDKTIRVEGLNSRPYIDLTLKVLEEFGFDLPENKNYKAFYFPERITPRNTAAPPNITYTVESDWSSAAFLLVAGAIAGNVTVKGLDVFTTQADKKILEALQDCGCYLSIQMEQIEVRKHALKPFHFDATHCPDLFPPLVALAACCGGTSVIEGVHRLEHKESNRAMTLQDEFQKLGITITIQDDKMLIRGGTVRGGRVHSRHDHRIAMACAVVALAATGAVEIEAAGAIAKSYPGFFDDLAQLTADNGR